MKQYVDFEIRVSALDGARYGVSVHGRGGDADGIFVPPTLDPVYQALADRLARLDTDEPLLVQLGQALFRALFPHKVHEVYARSQAMLMPDQGLRLRLIIPAADVLVAALPWEFLYDPDQGPLALLDASVMRYIPQSSPIPSLETPLPLRVLLTAAQTPPPTEVERELREVEAALAGLGQHVQITVVPHLTRQELQRRLREGFHIWHFVGHGGYNRDGKIAQLSFEDATGDVEPVSATELNIMLHRSGLRLVVLDACEGARLAVDPFRSVAPALIRAQIPAVVAMQFAAPQEATRTFAGEFYRTLAEGLPLDACVTEGRKAVMGATGLHNPDWGIPVVYTRAPDGHLFDIGRAAAPGPAVQAADLIEAPPEPARPPELSDFVGRAAELAAYMEQLATNHMAVITGLAGVGKTTVAAALARQASDPQKIFWHSFYKSEGLDSLTWGLAGFLAINGQPEVWRLLQTARKNGAQPPPPDVLFDYLIQTLRGQGYLLCLDDFQFVAEDPLVDKFITRLRRELHASDGALIITSRQVPEVADDLRVAPLGGLTVADARRLLVARRVDLADDLVDQLVSMTGGNAQLLILSMDVLQKARDPARMIARLEDSDNIERYLMREVDTGLSEEERGVMGAVAALLGYGGTRDAIEAVLDGENVRRALHRLTERHLLSVSEGEEEKEYSQHAIVQAFYYEQISRRERQAMHRRAAAYYEAERPDGLKAARHYERAGEYPRAATLATADTAAIINRGQARALEHLLSQLPATGFEPALRAAVHTARGEVTALLAEYAVARQQLEQALACGAVLEAGPAQIEVQARRRRLLALVGERTGDYEQAEADCRNGLLLIAALELPNLESARLHAQLAEVLYRRSRYDSAAAACRDGLVALPPEPEAPRERAALLQRLATINGQRGRYTEAIDGLEDSLSLADRAGDSVLTGVILHNLGCYLTLVGQDDRALACYAQSLRIKEQIGDAAGRVPTLINQGTIYMDQDYATALRCFEESRALCERLNLPGYLASATVNIGIVQYSQGQLDEAADSFLRAQAVFRSLDDLHGLADSLYRLGDVELARGDSRAAQEYGERTLALAHQIGAADHESSALRVIGVALLQQGQLDDAATSLNLAWQLQQEIGDPHDQALILTALARLALARGDAAQASAHIEAGLELAREQHAPYLIGLLNGLEREVGAGS